MLQTIREFAAERLDDGPGPEAEAADARTPRTSPSFRTHAARSSRPAARGGARPPGIRAGRAIRGVAVLRLRRIRRPAELLDYSRLAESRRAGGSSRPPTTSSRGATVAATRRRRCPGWARSAGRDRTAVLGTSVLTPTLRYHPRSSRRRSRRWVPVPGAGLPRRRHRRGDERDARHRGSSRGARSGARRLAEAIELIRALWREERVDFDGEYYRPRGRDDLRPAREPVPIYVAASGPLAASSPAASATASSAPAARTRSSTARCSPKVAEGARPPAATRRDPAHDRDQGLLRPRRRRAHDACAWWARAGADARGEGGRRGPDRDGARSPTRSLDRAHTRFIVSDDPERWSSGSASYLDLGFDDLCSTARARTRRASSRSSPRTSSQSCGPARTGRGRL